MNIKQIVKSIVPTKAREIIKSTVYKYIDTYKDNQSNYYIRKTRGRRNTHEKIKVVFLVQMPEIWDKQIPLYDALVKDNRFDTAMIVVPEYDFVNKCVQEHYCNNYFFDLYPNAKRAFDIGSWLNLKSINPDYVFFQRPYDTYLPRGYKSSDIVKYAKCCYVPYAFWPLKESLCGYNKEFFRNVYFAFMESRENAEEIAKLEKDTNRIRFCGYPSLDIREEKIVESKEKMILWTPRWSYSKSVGGSHFFEYKDQILSLAEEYQDWKIVIRPHPLAFDNYISTGLMTKEEVEAYKSSANKRNIEFDSNALITDTFGRTSIIISDISSIIYTYFLTCKPIIFCSTQVGYSPSFMTLLDGMYIANNWDEIENYIKMLSAGNDPLKQKREAISDRLKADNTNAVNNITEIIIDDYYGG